MRRCTCAVMLNRLQTHIGGFHSRITCWCLCFDQPRGLCCAIQPAMQAHLLSAGTSGYYNPTPQHAPQDTYISHTAMCHTVHRHDALCGVTVACMARICIHPPTCEAWHIYTHPNVMYGCLAAVQMHKCRPGCLARLLFLLCCFPAWKPC